MHFMKLPGCSLELCPTFETILMSSMTAFLYFMRVSNEHDAVDRHHAMRDLSILVLNILSSPIPTW